jgi:PAS domain S-box-containing protein
MNDKARIIRISTWLAGMMALFVALLLPLGYYVVSYQRTAGSLEAETEVNSRIFSGLISANPDLWRYEQMRLEELLARRPRSGQKEIRRIVDLHGKVVAESVEQLPPPLIKRSYDLKDSGVTVARIEISRSMRPSVMRTGLVALLGLAIGLIIFFAMRILPFRSLIQADSALRTSEERFRKIFELSPLGIAILGMDYRFVAVNGMLREMLGYTDEELTALKFSDVIHPDDGSDDSQRLLSESVPSLQVEKRYIRKDGAHHWGHLMSSMIRDEKTGNPRHFLVMLEDVTKNRNLESQLRQSQKMEAVGQLAGGVAHDFNNMLTVIMGSATLLQMKIGKDDAALSFVEQILSSAEKAADLTRGLLAFSRKQFIQPHPVDLNIIVKNTKKLLTRLIPEDIELQTSLAGENLVVMADPSQIDQVLLNLVTNARDAMPNGGVLTIETSSIEITKENLQPNGFAAAGRFAMLAISDTGPGMDESTKARIFEPFFTTKEMGKGTGLGLAVIYGIVQQHNGSINVESEAGQGTTIKVCLPLIKEEAARPGGAEVIRTALGGTETILIVEDNPEVRNLTKEVVEQYGYRVIEAVDGQDGVAKFRENQDAINLVIMDVIMPKMNGKEAFAEMEKIRPAAKVLFTSGYTASIISDKGHSMKETNFISKPARPQELLQKIREILQGP